MLKELINQADFSITTERTNLLPLSYDYLNEYFEEFNSDITKYQYPDPFTNLSATKVFFNDFIQLRKEGKSLICIITDIKGAFIGSVEAHNIDTAAPELGIWIAQKHQAKGYGFEVIEGFMNYISANHAVDHFIYEADIRNAGSIKLINKLMGEKQGHEEFVTDSGKELKLDKYYIRGDKKYV